MIDRAQEHELSPLATSVHRRTMHPACKRIRTSCLYLAVFMSWQAAPLSAQAEQAPQRPEAPLVDENGVSIPADYISASAPVLQIGGLEPIFLSIVNHPSGYDAGGRPASCSSPADSSCASEPYLRSGFYPQFNLQTSLEGGVNYSDPASLAPPEISFSYGGISETFGQSNWTTSPPPPAGHPKLHPSKSLNGGELIELSYHQYRYTDRNGVVYHIGKPENIQVSGYAVPVTKIEYPNGRVVELTYKKLTSTGISRLQDVRDNYGFFVKLEFDSNTYSAANPKASRWARRIKAGNLVHDTCAQASNTCSLTKQKLASNSWNSEASTIEIGTAGGEITGYTQNYYWEITGVRPIGSDIETVAYEMCGRTAGTLCSGLSTSGSGGGYWPDLNVGWVTFPGKVNRAFREGETVQYASTNNAGGYALETQFSNDYRGVRTLIQRYHPFSSELRGQYMSLTDYDGTVYGYTGDDTSRLVSVAQHERVVEYQYDNRANITSITERADDNSQSRTRSFVYPATCTSRITCNKPTRIIDAKGNETDFTYDPTHGGLLTVSGPPDDNGVRPQTRYSYTKRFAYYRNNSGTIVKASKGIWLLTSERYCRTSSWTGSLCQAGASDEVVTKYDYGPTTGANNLLLRGMAVSVGGETLRTCYSYNAFGDRISETMPAANLTSCP